MKFQQTYIDGVWVPARGSSETPVLDSYTEQPFASYRTSSLDDVNLAVGAASRALESWGALPVEARIGYVRKIASALEERADELTQMISRVVGMPRKLAARVHVD